MPYAINGFVVLIASLFLFLLYMRKPYVKQESAVQLELENLSQENKSTVDKAIDGLKERLPCKSSDNATDIVVFACLTMLFYSGDAVTHLWLTN